MGATVQADGVTFRLWAPAARAAFVAGDFSDAEVALKAEPGGMFAATVASAHVESTYRFVLQTDAGRLDRFDPYCREIVESGTLCRVKDPSAYVWKTGRFDSPARSASVVYELHIGAFAVPKGASYGTFLSARDKLAELADLGVNVVELMPVQAFGGRPNGWGYNPQLYLAPKPSYGKADDLRAFVDEAHRLGIAVWIDVVINHMDRWKQAPLICFEGGCPDGRAGMYFFPDGPYAQTPWGPRPNYSSPEVSSMLKAAANEWLVAYRGNGFRVDSVSNIRGNDGVGTTPSGRELLLAMNELAHEAGGLSIAEDLKGYAAITQSPSSGGFGFDAQWDGFGYDVTAVLTAKTDDARDMGLIERVLTGSYGGDPFARLLWTENHDTVGNRGARLPNKIDPVTPTSVAARKRSMLAATLLMTTPGVPMLFMGQEALATLGFTDPPAALPSPTDQGMKIRAFYKDLIALRRGAQQAGALLDTGVEILHRNDMDKVIAYRRHGPSGEDVIVLLNFRNRDYARYDIGAPVQGNWNVRLNTDRKIYGDDFGDGQTGQVSTIAQQKDGRPQLLRLRLGAYGALVLTR